MLLGHSIVDLTFLFERILACVVGVSLAFVRTRLSGVCRKAGIPYSLQVSGLKISKNIRRACSGSGFR